MNDSKFKDWKHQLPPNGLGHAVTLWEHKGSQTLGSQPEKISGLLLDIVQKGGGVQSESKSFAVVFFCLLLDITEIWGSFEAVLLFLLF